MKYAYALDQWKPQFDDFVRRRDHERALKTITIAGFTGVQLSSGTGRWEPFGNPDQLAANFGSAAGFADFARACALDGLAAWSLDVTAGFHEDLSAGADPRKPADRDAIVGHARWFAEAIAQAGGDVLVVRPAPGGQAGPADESGIAAAADCWNAAGRATAEFGVRTAVRFDFLSSLRLADGWGRLLAALDPSLVSVAVDTGELAAGGRDPLAEIADSPLPIGHVILSNALAVDDLDEFTRPGAEFSVRRSGGSRGIPRWFGELEDDGLVDVAAVITALREREYTGWVVVNTAPSPNAATSALLSGYHLHTAIAGGDRMTRFPESVDVVIVGSGPNGAAYARILSELAPTATIAMFEVGPTVSNPPGAHVKNIPDLQARSSAQYRSEGPGAGQATMSGPGAVQTGQRKARPGTFLLPEGYAFDGEDGLPLAAMSSNVGGMGAHWTCACPRPGGQERIDFLPDFDDLLAEGERLLGVTTSAFDGAPFSDLVRERLAAAVDEGRTPPTRVQRMPLAVHRRENGELLWSGSDVVMGEPTRSNPNFGLHDEALVTRVLLEDGRAAGVEVRDLRGDETHTVRAGHVVVAADALRTPQVLFASGIRPQALGRYLNDQSQVVYAARITGADVATAPSVVGVVNQHSGVQWVPFTDDLPFHGQIMQLDASPIPLADDDPVLPGSIVGLGLFCAKDLRSEDRLEFAEDATDAYGLPAIRVHYALTEHDHQVLDQARTTIVSLARAVGEPLGDAPITLPLGASLHYQGTTRMGEVDDGTSVCGPDSEVWSAPGVFVAGNNVIPTSTACNPTLTSVALAVRGARRIAEELTRTS